MTTHIRPGERGEGRIGCVVSLLALIVCIALAVKIVPFYYNNDQLIDFAEELGGKAGTMNEADVNTALRAKAQKLGIPEALTRGAMVVTLHGDHNAGSCEVNFKYTQNIDLYGVYVLTVDTKKKILMPFVDNR
jgi:hypothetical protein